MNIWPSNISTILDIERHIVDFPAPVLPTTPIFSPFYTLKDSLFKTISVSGLYFKDAPENSIWPSSGQLSLPSSKSIYPWSTFLSYGISKILRHLFTLTILAWKNIKHFKNHPNENWTVITYDRSIDSMTGSPDSSLPSTQIIEIMNIRVMATKSILIENHPLTPAFISCAKMLRFRSSWNPSANSASLLKALIVEVPEIDSPMKESTGLFVVENSLCVSVFALDAELR